MCYYGHNSLFLVSKQWSLGSSYDKGVHRLQHCCTFVINLQKTIIALVVGEHALVQGFSNFWSPRSSWGGWKLMRPTSYLMATSHKTMVDGGRVIISWQVSCLLLPQWTCIPLPAPASLFDPFFPVLFTITSSITYFFSHSLSFYSQYIVLRWNI